MGASVSSVAGSSVGVAGGALSIAGLALAPVTAGMSLILTMTGVGLGVASGVNSLATGITGMVVNSKHSKQANSIFQNFMDDVQSILDCMERVASHTAPIAEPGKTEILLGTGRVVAKVCGLGKSIDALVDGASALKVIGSKEVATGVTKVGLQHLRGQPAHDGGRQVQTQPQEPALPAGHQAPLSPAGYSHTHMHTDTHATGYNMWYGDAPVLS